MTALANQLAGLISTFHSLNSTRFLKKGLYRVFKRKSQTSLAGFFVNQTKGCEAENLAHRPLSEQFSDVARPA